MLWTDKYFPKNFDEFIGNVEIVGEARKWASLWENGGKGPALFFFGPTGLGKTCLAFLIAKRFGWNVFELNAGDLRNKDVVEKVVGVAAQGSSFTGKKRLVLLDEVDGLQSNDRGGAAAISKIIKESQNPVILTANNIYKDKKLAPLRQNSKLMQFKRINYLSLASRLKEILAGEGIDFDPDAVKELAKNSKGDFRSALIDAQTLSFSGKIDAEAVSSLGFRERQESVFKVVEAIFKGTNLNDVRAARFSSEINSDLLFRWVEENIPRVYEGDDIARAFSVLSRADIFEGRIFNRQHYGFKRYSTELFSSGVALAKEREYHGWLKFQFPQLLKSLSASSSKRAMKKGLGRKIGGKTHSSAKQVIAEDLVFLKMLFGNKEKAAEYAASFDLELDEIAFLMGTKPSTKKAKTVFEKSVELRQAHIASKRHVFSPTQESTHEEREEREPDQNQTKLF